MSEELPYGVVESDPPRAQASVERRSDRGPRVEQRSDGAPRSAKVVEVVSAAEARKADEFWREIRERRGKPDTPPGRDEKPGKDRRPPKADTSA